MAIASLLVGGFYPLTQIYQHQEDKKRGDYTISYLLGYKGTFLFSASLFVISSILFFIYFTYYYAQIQFFIFIVCLLPVLFYFLYWFSRVIKDPDQANFSNAMHINQLSAPCMILCFILIFFLNHYS